MIDGYWLRLCSFARGEWKEENEERMNNMITPELVQKEAKKREKTIPVDVPIDSFYSDVNMVALCESIE